MDALAKAHKVLSSRMSDPKAKMFGLADDLKVINDAFTELERRIGILAAVALHNHYWPGEKMHVANWKALSEMSDYAREIHEVADHGRECTCMTCMARVLRAQEALTNVTKG